MKRRRRQEGVALLLAMLFVVLLTAIVVEYAYQMQVEATLVANDANDLEAYVAAKSAVSSGISMLAEDLLVEQGVAGAAFDSLQDVWAVGMAFSPLNDATMQCVIDDEFGKLNINALVREERQAAGDSTDRDESTVVVEDEAEDEEAQEELVEVFRAFFEKRGAEEEVVDAIIDWIDSDDDTTGNGAESDFYNGLDVPYNCKNAPLDSIEELLLVKGITPELYFGNLEEGFLPLPELLTVRGDRRGRVNVNTAEPEVLEALGEAMGLPGLADTVLEAREQYPYQSDQELDEAGLTPQNTDPADTAARGRRGSRSSRNRRNPYLTVRSQVFRVRGHGMAGDSKVRVEAYVWRGEGETTGTFQILDWRVMR